MTAEVFCRLRKEIGLPLADQRVILEGCFSSSLEEARRNPEKNFSEGKAERILAKIKSGYPANYLAGYRDVQKRRLFLNEDTLIPRNETIWFVFDYLKNNYDFQGKKVLDLCSGSGLIALGIKKLFPLADVTASDISASAIKEAKKSSLYNHLPVSFILSDFLSSIEGCFDFLLCNPPYIEENSKEVYAPYEPKLALFSGKDGCDSYRAIFPLLDSHLSERGTAFFELESTNVNAVLSLAKEKLPSYSREIIDDLYHRPRYLKRVKN